MRKKAYFDSHWGIGWPSPSHIESCLSDSVGRRSFFAKGYDGGSFLAEGLYGTEGLMPKSGRIDVTLYMYANPTHGILLIYSKWDGTVQVGHSYHSKGDLSRLREHVNSFHGTALPIGLFIPFDAGCSAMREFIERDGELPTTIEWIVGTDLPPNTYPAPPRPTS
jgi:hypothetical protein